MAYWRAFDAMEPIGFPGLNYLFAKLQQTVLIASPKFKSDKPVSLDKLLLDFDPDIEQFLDEEELKQFNAQKMKAFFSQFSRS